LICMQGQIIILVFLEYQSLKNPFHFNYLSHLHFLKFESTHPLDLCI
jgi:hypothetical protein